MKKSFTILFIMTFPICFSQVPGYSYGKQIIIQSSQVSGSSDLQNFPVLISLTDGDLKSTNFGGHVENPNGFDFVFTSDDCQTLLDYQIESYHPNTGSINVWVKVPSLSATKDYGLYMYYGNPNVSADPSSTQTWSSGYDGVWHLHDDLLDAAGTGNNGTNHGTSNTSTAQIADGQNFTYPNDWIAINNHPNRTGSFSYSGWFKTNDISQKGQRIICDDETNASGGYAVSIGDQN